MRRISSRAATAGKELGSPRPADRSLPSRKLPFCGPLADLEPYVSPAWWDELFDELYLKTDGDVVENSAIARDEIDFFLRLMPLAEHERILDLCCGQGRHALELARRGFSNIVGIDGSAFLLNEAESRARQAALPVAFHQGDARSIPQEDASFDATLLLGNSFGYFASANDDRAMLRDIARVLRPGGKLLLDVTEGNYVRTHFEPRSWEWIGQNMFACRERSLSAARDQLISREIITHTSRGVIADRFYAERLYDADEIVDLLTQIGFVSLGPPSRFASSSTRNQDLGMMAQRLVFVAQKPLR